MDLKGNIFTDEMHENKWKKRIFITIVSLMEVNIDDLSFKEVNNFDNWIISVIAKTEKF